MTLKTWLSLTLAVLLVHLALLHRLPSSLHTMPTGVTPSFATRTVVLPTNATTLASVKATEPDQPKPTARPARKAVPIPAPQPVTASGPSGPADNSAAMAAADANAAAVDSGAAPAAEPIASAASAPASAADDTTEQVSAGAESAPVPESVIPSPVQDALFSADGLPASVKLVYVVESNKFPYRLGSELLWQQNRQTYQARTSISAFGLERQQTSHGRIDEYGLAPERFSDKFRSEVAAHFNRERGVVTFSANTPDVPLQPGAQDRLSVTIQLAALVASAPQGFAPGTTLSIQTIGPRGGEIWLFTFGAMEALELPGGGLQGLKLWRQPRNPYDQKLEVWLAPELAYMPARIRITETNGDFVDQKWQASQEAESP